ncbi:hypothetical protein [Gordonia sp. NB41Y]|uniref:hypothetical protein n=1 Tax=Gordonia sp. NB41Y TaxID=875808 RepID=UPI0002BF3DC3|nr:hypothetical protein [Gordonia sp. NB41Y]EMP14985.1 hypothetical protein ISGA_522 [Gordonia sp. NB41Y]WLP88534.1 hypothetical protein Q9K23_12940 [Gordonia sp. NB41Y]
MGITAKQWRELAIGAAEVLGDEWVVAGKGASTRLVRVKVGWWLQFVGYENTRLGRLVAPISFLGRPPCATEMGDKGAVSDRFVMPGEDRARKFEHLQTPDALAEWIWTVTRERSDQVPELREELTRLEARKVDIGDDPVLRFAGRSLQYLVSLRVVCGSRSREEFVADIDEILGDKFLEGHGMLASTRKEPRTYQAYFTALRDAVAGGDRGVVETVIDDARQDALRLLGVADDAIGDVVFPEPMVAL